MRDRLERFKIRKQIHQTIRDSAERIRVVKNEVEQAKADLNSARTNPDADGIILKLFEYGLAGMEKNLADFQTAHAQFVEEQAQPSAAFPCGIASCQESTL